MQNKVTQCQQFYNSFSNVLSESYIFLDIYNRRLHYMECDFYNEVFFRIKDVAEVRG